MFVACSTLCFGRQPLEQALRSIATLQFGKYDMALLEHGCQLKPSEVAADVHAAAARLRVGPGLVPAAFTVGIDAPDEAEHHRQFKAVCRLARLCAVPVVTVKPASSDVPLEAEAARLAKLVRLADADGILVCAATLAGTHTATPQEAVRLCESVPGLCLTLDPSHWIAEKGYDEVFPLVRHVHLRDTGRGPDQFQVRVGQGGIEYGRITAQLERCRYGLALSVDIRDIPDAPFAMEPEVRKLKYLLESLV
ncbi:MAG: sugar phosphate isomerase/epimerase [Gemmataceae bacterium]|nr:sugar phosphate isomerase/epimerase [Gemmataceae bacterium]